MLSLVELESKATELQTKLAKLNEELKEVNTRIDEAVIKKREYKLNDIPDRIWYDYKSIVEDLVEHFRNDEVVSSVISNILQAHSIKLGKDPVALYNCPECGSSESLYIGEYHSSTDGRKFAITCSRCDFAGPHVKYKNDAWEKFHRWLVKTGYLEEN